MEGLEALVIGAGQAGLAVSHHLRRAGLRHLVLERARIAESWRSQRWDTFALNTPSWMNRLPGEDDAAVADPRDGFLSHLAFAERLEAYAASWDLPVRERVTVTRAETATGDDRLVIHVEGALDGPIEARSLVVASGFQNVPRIPPLAGALPPRIVQLHSLSYRHPGQLPPGAVLIVGSGQTGGQIAEDLLDAGRTVYLSASRVARFRRRHRGRDILDWLDPAGWWEVTPDLLPDPAMRFAAQPLISGVGRLGRTLSLQGLAGRGAILVGRIWAVDGEVLHLEDTVAGCLRFGDERSAEICRFIDRWIEAARLPLPPLEDDPADEPHPDPASVRSPERLDLAALGIGSVVWATGVRGAFDWLPPPVVDADGAPIHERGVSPVPGIFFLGLPWLTRRGSGIIHGVGTDAGMIADQVVRRAETG